MPNRIKKRFNNYLFDLHCRHIWSTPPICPVGRQLIIVSMVCHLDLIMYLIAIKTFYFHIKQGSIVVLNDGTLTSKDIMMLRYHVSPSEIIDARKLKSNKVPTYLSWKKLLFIANYVDKNYVIQLDSDTVTLGDIAEITKCVESNQSFILGTWEDQEIESMKDACQRVKLTESQHVQQLSERNFDRLPNYNQLKYVRGCSGFDGFAKGSFSLEELEDFSQKMERIVGGKWSEWGSEQTTSNYLIANDPNSLVLPYPKYASYQPSNDYKESTLLHFIGAHRFKKGVYIRTAKSAIKNI